MKLLDATKEAQATANETGLMIAVFAEGPHADEFAEYDTDGQSYAYCPEEAVSKCFKWAKIVARALPESDPCINLLTEWLKAGGLSGMLPIWRVAELLHEPAKRVLELANEAKYEIHRNKFIVVPSNSSHLYVTIHYALHDYKATVKATGQLESYLRSQGTPFAIGLIEGQASMLPGFIDELDRILEMDHCYNRPTRTDSTN